MKFDLIVIGGGAAGLVSAGFAGKIGVNVGLVSDGHPGGECLWSGCVPSKALIASAKVAHVLETSSEFGFPNTQFKADFNSVMTRMRKVRDEISHHDSKETIEGYGAKVFYGKARFISNQAVEVNGEELHARKFIIATGASQRIVPIDGLAEVGCLTHESILELSEQPRHLAILGGGPVGVEYAQVFARLGTKVTIIEMLDRILSKEEPETSLLMSSVLALEKVDVLTDCKVSRVTTNGVIKTLFVEGPKGVSEINCDAILISTGKRANTEFLNLDAVQVELDAGFIKVDQHQRTTASNIWACGDVCKGYQFTHYADHQARVAIMNACLRLPVKRETRIVPWCIFSEPEIASVGLRESEAVLKFGQERVLVLKYEFKDYDRAILDGATEGFIKISLLRDGTIVGASVVSERAGELIHEFAIAMKKGMKVQELANLMHVYPTMSSAIGNCAADYYRKISDGGVLAKFLRTWVRLVK